MNEEVKAAFESLDWHDAVLLSILIDRKSPGERDEVVLAVRWDDEKESRIHFRDCYGLEATLNFGVLAPETIRDARWKPASPRLVTIRAKWSALGVDLSNLQCFEISTNSTASTLRVFARRFDITG